MSLVESALAWPARRPRTAATVAALLTLAALPWLPRLRVDNGLERWIDRDGSEYRRYRELLEDFGSEETVLVVYPLDARELALDEIAALHQRLETIPGVREVQDLSAIREGFFADVTGEDFRRDVLESPFYRGLFVSADGTLAATRVLLAQPGPDSRAPLMAAIREAVDATSGVALSTREIHLAGPPVLNVALDQASRRAARTFLPWVFALSGALLWLLFRRWAAVAIPFLSVGAGVAWTLALLAASGRSLDMVTVALPPVLWVLGLSTSVHLLVRTGRGHTGRETVPTALADLARPCFVSALTTALGFASLTLGSMEPVRTMGLFGALGVMLCLGSNFLLFPFLADWLRIASPAPTGDTPPQGSPLAHTLAHRWIAWLDRRPWPVLAVSALLAIGLGLSVTRLEADSNVVKFFRPGTEIAETYGEVLPRLTGPYSLEVLLDPGLDPGRRPSPADLRQVDRLADRLAQRPGVARVVSPLDLVKKTDQRLHGLPPAAFRLPDDDEELATLWDLTGLWLADERRELFDPDRGVLRLSVLARPMGSAATRKLEEDIRDELDRTVPATWNPRLTGMVDLLVATQERLLTSQIRSFAAAFLWIVPVLAWMLRSVRDALLSLPPNLFPILLSLGGLGLLGLPLDPATMMVAGVALGIAVDDTIHMLTAYRRFRASLPASPALARTLETVGRPVVLTTVIASLGFSVLALSDFTPLLRFGLLTATTLVAALFADLVLLPALLRITDSRPIEETVPCTLAG